MLTNIRSFHDFCLKSKVCYQYTSNKIYFLQIDMCSKTSSYVYIQVDFVIFLEVRVKSWCFLLTVYSNVWLISYESPNSDILINIFVKSSNVIFWRSLELWNNQIWPDHHFLSFEWELLNFYINLMLREMKSVKYMSLFHHGTTYNVLQWYSLSISMSFMGLQ